MRNNPKTRNNNMTDNILPERTPDEIRDDAMKVFNQMAPAKYDDGQARQEITSNLDKHPDLIQAKREEIMDLWFYNESQARELDELKLRIDKLEKRNAYLEGTLRA